MQFLSSGPNDDLNHSFVHTENRLLPDVARGPYTTIQPPAEEEAGSFQLGRALRKYWLLILALMILGAFIGLVSVLLSSPMYQSRLMVEMQNPNGGLVRNDGSGN